MSLTDTLTADIATAMKARDTTKLTALRMLKTALTNKSIEKSKTLEGSEELQVRRRPRPRNSPPRSTPRSPRPARPPRRTWAR
jgi:uncharacterized protein YqeY